MPSTYYVAWWNLENLFDEENAPASRRTDKVFRAIKDDIAGWTPQSRDRKVDQLASVIAQMNAGGGPDLLGVCEVENRFARVTLRRGERRRDEVGPCPYCGAAAVLVSKVLKGDGGRIVGRPHLIRVECSNPQCPGEDVNQGPLRAWCARRPRASS
jgi:hypothetical protein